MTTTSRCAPGSTQSLFSGSSALSVLVVLAVGYSIWCLGYQHQAVVAGDFRSHRARDIAPDGYEHGLTERTDG